MMDFADRSETGRRLLTFWQARLCGRTMPARADLDPIEMGLLLPNIFLVNVTAEPLDFNYRLLGTAIVDRSMRDYTGERLSDLPSQRAPSTIWSLYEEAVREQRPALAQVPHLNIPKLYVEMQALPLSNDGHSVNMLIGSVVFEHGSMYGSDEPAI
jgi:hypothetical protein